VLGIFRVWENELKPKAVGFYWTLPVPWAGFATLPFEIDEAAKYSRTIRFQRKLIHDYARRNGLELIYEQAFLEIDPDRGSKFIHAALDKAAAKCRDYSAVLLFVDFSAVQGWRSHEPMLAWLRQANVESLPIEAAAITMDGDEFNPHVHFANWRMRQREWIDNKDVRKSAAIARAQELKASGLQNPAIAQQLNSEGVRSLSGKPWSADGVRKFLLAT